MKKINTLRFGELEIEEDKIVQFDEGIPAFEDEHEFVLLPYESDSPYTFLQSVKSPELAFMMGVPFVFFPDYEFQLEDEIAQKLGIKTPEDILIYTLITIPGGEIKPVTEVLVGAETVNAIRRYHFTLGFWGTNGIGLETGFTTPEFSEAAVKQISLEHTVHPYILADSSKFSQVSLITFADYNGAVVITDRLPEGEGAYRSAGNVVEVEEQ